jgi:hypothetical protein
MKRVNACSIALLAASLLGPATASAQESNLVTTPGANPLAGPGWSLTPSLTYAGVYDDNVLVRGGNNDAPADYLNVLNPALSADYNGRRSQFSASYDGAFLLYRDLSTLNSYDQHGWLYGRRMLTRRVALFVRNTMASVPTTELAELVAVPFVRTGSRLDDLQGGVEVAFSKRTSLSASYDFEWVDFDHSQPGAEGLLGGHSSGGTANLRHALNARVTFLFDYKLQHAIVATIGQTFDVQNGGVGLEYKLSDRTFVSASGGISHLASTETATSRTGPAVRVTLAHHVHRADVTLDYSRMFIPSYGFGGTMQNEEADARLRVPLARRVYVQGGVSWRRNDPLTELEFPLRSVWLEGTLGYAMTQWARLEVFYGGTHQDTDQPGGELDRNRFGLQIVTAKPVRIR